MSLLPPACNGDPTFYRAMHFSAKRGLAIACRPCVRPSVCDVDGLLVCDHIGWKSWKLTPSLFAAIRRCDLRTPRRTWGNFGETRGGVEKSGVLQNKSGNISETRKDRGKVTMDDL